MSLQIDDFPIEEFEALYFEQNQRKAFDLPDALKSGDYLEYLVETYFMNPYIQN